MLQPYCPSVQVTGRFGLSIMWQADLACQCWWSSSQRFTHDSCPFISSGIHEKIFATVFLYFIAGECHVNITTNHHQVRLTQCIHVHGILYSNFIVIVIYAVTSRRLQEKCHISYLCDLFWFLLQFHFKKIVLTPLRRHTATSLKEVGWGLFWLNIKSISIDFNSWTSYDYVLIDFIKVNMKEQKLLNASRNHSQISRK